MVIWSDQWSGDESEMSLSGGKGQGLFRLLKHGARVPPFFVVLPEDSQKTAVEAYNTKRWECVAVRSSALGEDGVEHSFAGMYESVLGVRSASGLKKAISICRKSSQSERVLSYRMLHNLEDTPVAVIVQEMIEGEVSGVMFTHDPINPDAALISAGYGLGEGVVQGITPCDTIRVQGRSVEREIAVKDTALRLRGTATTEFAIEEERQERCCLSEDQSLRLAKEGRRLAEAFGRPLDIEWTLRDNVFYLLQARPITQDLPSGRKLLWDNANIIESYCGLTLPLTYSFASRAYTIVYQLFCQVMGVPERRIRKYSTVFPRMIGLIRGRIFYNLNAWYTVVSLLPGYQWNKDFMEGMMGVTEVAGDSDAAPAEGNWFTVRLNLCWLMLGMAWRVWRLDSDCRRFHNTVEQALSDHPAKGMEQRTALELLDVYADLERRLLWAWHTPIVNDFFVMIAHGLLRKMCDKRFPHERDIHNALLSGEGGMISAAPALAVERLSSLIRKHSSLQEAFVSYSEGVVTPDLLKKQLAEYPKILAAYEQYIDQFGDRCADELKLETETLRHNDRPLLQTIAASLKAEPRALKYGESELRSQAEQLVDRTLSGWDAWLFQRVLRWARKRVQSRENLRFERTRVFARVREVFRSMGALLTDKGVLKHRRDVFYLTVDEVFGWVQATTVTVRLDQLVQLRKTEYAQWDKDGPPSDRFHTWGAVWHNNVFAGNQRVLDGDGIRGTPACPGLVEGIVRRIEDPTQETLLPGEVLLCYRTDPGWAPLFPNAAAILVERGSLLSHSAVVARELGIPTIVAIPDVMNRLQTGQRVRVHATDGLVELLGDENE